MSACGLDECDIYGGCYYGCAEGKERKRLNRERVKTAFKIMAAQAEKRIEQRTNNPTEKAE